MPRTSARCGDPKTWQFRVSRLPSKPVVFINGSGLSRTPVGGAWSVRQVVDHTKELLRAMGSDVQVPEPDHQAYQVLMEHLLRADPDEADRVVRRAVLNACLHDEGVKQALELGAGGRESCAVLQRQSDLWRLPPAVAAQAEIISVLESRRKRGAQSTCVLTTNFDGFLEIALSKLGVAYESHSIIADKWPTPSVGAVDILHVHGFWTDDVTLHTQEDLEMKRELLREALRQRLSGAEVRVMGYGAWNDVVFQALGEVASGRFQIAPRIAWSFFEPEPSAIEIYAHVFDALNPIGSRVAYFADVDLQVRLPEAATALKLSVAPPIAPSPSKVHALTPNAEVRNENGVFSLGYETIPRDGERRMGIQVFADTSATLHVGGVLLIVAALLAFLLPLWLYVGIMFAISLVALYFFVLPYIKTTQTAPTSLPAAIKGALASVVVAVPPIAVPAVGRISGWLDQGAVTVTAHESRSSPAPPPSQGEATLPVANYVSDPFKWNDVAPAVGIPKPDRRFPSPSSSGSPAIVVPTGLSPNAKGPCEFACLGLLPECEAMPQLCATPEYLEKRAQCVRDCMDGKAMPPPATVGANPALIPDSVYDPNSISPPKRNLGSGGVAAGK